MEKELEQLDFEERLLRNERRLMLIEEKRRKLQGRSG